MSLINVVVVVWHCALTICMSNSHSVFIMNYVLVFVFIFIWGIRGWQKLGKLPSVARLVTFTTKGLKGEKRRFDFQMKIIESPFTTIHVHSGITSSIILIQGGHLFFSCPYPFQWPSPHPLLEFPGLWALFRWHTTSSLITCHCEIRSSISK